MKPRHCHVAPALKDRLLQGKASRRKARDLAMAERLAASQSEVRQQRCEVSSAWQVTASIATQLQDAKQQLRDLAEVLPARFVGVNAPHDQDILLAPTQSSVHLHTDPAPVTWSIGAGFSEAVHCCTTVEAVRALVGIHHDEMAKQLHAWLRVAAPGHGDASAAYVVSLQALRDTDPGVLARTITREMQPLFKQQLVALQLRLLGRYQGR